MSTFFQFQRLTNGRDSRKIGNNTRAIKLADDCYGIELHNTIVVKAYLDGRIVLNSGGWQSVTTKQRMNAYIPACVGVTQKDFKWFVSVDRWQSTVPYEDGFTMVEDNNGKVTVR